MFYSIGTCRDLVGDYECSCRSGFSGRNCQFFHLISTLTPPNTGIVPRCDSNSCGNGGTCMQDSNSTYCLCPLWFSGERCETSLRNFSPSQVSSAHFDLSGLPHVVSFCKYKKTRYLLALDILSLWNDCEHVALSIIDKIPVRSSDQQMSIDAICKNRQDEMDQTLQLFCFLLIL